MKHEVAVQHDLTYAEVGGVALLADLYRPELDEPPAVIYVHGGGWAVGSRTDHAQERLTGLASHGLAVLSVDYRLVDVAHFPAQLHDVRAAVRWLRASAADLGVQGERVGVWGASAGAVLASLVGLTKSSDFEGDAGAHPDQSCAVQAVVAWFGASDLLATTSRSGLESLLHPDGPEAAFLGVASVADVSEVPDLARRASPLTWVSADAPPFLVCHGDRDRVVPVSESEALHHALVRSGAQSSLLLLGGAGHEDAAFDSESTIALTAAFLRTTLTTP